MREYVVTVKPTVGTFETVLGCDVGADGRRCRALSRSRSRVPTTAGCCHPPHPAPNVERHADPAWFEASRLLMALTAAAVGISLPLGCGQCAADFVALPISPARIPLHVWDSTRGRCSLRLHARLRRSVCRLGHALAAATASAPPPPTAAQCERRSRPGAARALRAARGASASGVQCRDRLRARSSVLELRASANRQERHTTQRQRPGRLNWSKDARAGGGTVESQARWRDSP